MLGTMQFNIDVHKKHISINEWSHDYTHVHDQIYENQAEGIQ